MSRSENTKRSLLDLGVSDYEMGFFNTFGIGASSEIPAAILEVVDDLESVHPLTVRQVYYQCVVRQIVNSSTAGYGKVQGVLSKARKGGALDFRAIFDPHRKTNINSNEDSRSIKDHIKREKRWFLNSTFSSMLYVDLNEGSKYYIEVGLEKDALASLVSSTCDKYQINLNITKGQGSITMAFEMAQRYKIAIKQGKKPIYIHFGDLDPSGVGIPKSLLNNINDLLDGKKVELVMGGLTVEQVIELDIEDMDHPVKKGDPNYNQWFEEFGGEQRAYELDAVNPLKLPEFIDSKIFPFIDMELREENMKKAERKDEVLKRYKRRYYPEF